MRNATDLMVQYAQYHRDRRNISTHFVGVPLIVFSVGVLLARPAMELGSFVASPAWVGWVVATLWYLSRGNVVLGMVVSLATGALIALAQPFGTLGTATWLIAGLGTFLVGWAIQGLGHYYEGRKPAFIDDLVGILVAPMFIAAEALFSLGWGKALAAEIERRAGPTHLRDLHHSAA